MNSPRKYCPMQHFIKDMECFAELRRERMRLAEEVGKKYNKNLHSDEDGLQESIKTLAEFSAEGRVMEINLEGSLYSCNQIMIVPALLERFTHRARLQVPTPEGAVKRYRHYWMATPAQVRAWLDDTPHGVFETYPPEELVEALWAAMEAVEFHEAHIVHVNMKGWKA